MVPGCSLTGQGRWRVEPSGPDMFLGLSSSSSTEAAVEVVLVDWDNDVADERATEVESEDAAL